jgi:hypothetical protein
LQGVGWGGSRVCELYNNNTTRQIVDRGGIVYRCISLFGVWQIENRAVPSKTIGFALFSIVLLGTAFGKCRTIAYRVKQSGLHCSLLFCSVLHLANVEQCRTMARLLFCLVLHMLNAEQCRTISEPLYFLTFNILQLNKRSVTRARLCVSVALCVVGR